MRAVSHSRGRASCLLQALLNLTRGPLCTGVAGRRHLSPHHQPLLTSRFIISLLRPLICSSPIFLSFSSPLLALYFHVEQQPRCERFADVPCEAGAQTHPCIQTACGSGCGARSHQKPQMIKEEQRDGETAMLL